MKFDFYRSKQKKTIFLLKNKSAWALQSILTISHVQSILKLLKWAHGIGTVQDQERKQKIRKEDNKTSPYDVRLTHRYDYT